MINIPTYRYTNARKRFKRNDELRYMCSRIIYRIYSKDEETWLVIRRRENETLITRQSLTRIYT